MNQEMRSPGSMLMSMFDWIRGLSLIIWRIVSGRMSRAVVDVSDRRCIDFVLECVCVCVRVSVCVERVSDYEYTKECMRYELDVE